MTTARVLVDLSMATLALCLRVATARVLVDHSMATLALCLRVATAKALVNQGVVLSGSLTFPSLRTETGMPACQADGNSEQLTLFTKPVT